MYYLIKSSKVEIHESNLSYKDAKMIYGDYLCGCFGRLEYATIWKDFYNKDITSSNLKEKLN